MIYIPISPDGIEINHSTYSTRGGAIRALKNWAKRFEAPGYYLDSHWNKIPVTELLDFCSIETV